ncbi:hypothetical protein PFISCL1PPCAC_10679, partial [Pristionchus fissidentatus]
FDFCYFPLCTINIPRVHITHMAAFINWDNTIDLNVLLQKYMEIERRQKDAPITLELPEVADREPEPIRIGVGGDPPPQRFFTPPLQVQRNSFMYDELRQISRETTVKKIAILGCGELSFEKYSMSMIADAGVERIISIDVDETPLSKGVDRMSNFLYNMEETTHKRNALPVHIEVFKGNVSNPTPILSNLDVACSTEVIEHMPLEKATEMLRCVLEKIRPKAYIISTPNHEYNVVFNRNCGFRHDDHHFEFTREEFKNWLSDNVQAPYTYEIHFVGELMDYEHLSGATQFAVIRREGEESGNEIGDNEQPYEKVGDFVFRNSYYRLFESVVVGAFKKFIEAFHFDPQKQQAVGSLKFWRCSIESILQFRTEPTIEIGEEDSMLLLVRLFSLCFKSMMPDTDRPAISLSASTTRESVLTAIGRIFQ